MYRKKMFPKILKIAKVVPMYEKSYKKPETYRPITILSSLRKVFEKLIQKRMVKLWDKNEVIKTTSKDSDKKDLVQMPQLQLPNYGTDEIWDW